MKAIYKFTILSLIISQTLNAQKIGIGTTNPTAYLHIEHQLCDSFFINTNFNFEEIAPLTTGGDAVWEFTTLNDNGIARSGPVTGSDISWTEIQIDVPSDRNAILQFEAGIYIDAGSADLTFQLMLDNDVKYSWNSAFESEPYALVIPEGIHQVRWTYQHLEGGGWEDNFAYLDHVKISYIKEFAFLLRDGNEKYGRVLVSDEYGNGTWQTLQNLFFDKDNDTGILVEKSPDSDRIEIFNEGIEALQIYAHNNDIIFNTASSNILFGKNAGTLNTGNGNTFVGNQAGKENHSGSDNSFYGNMAGLVNETGERNSFFGSFTGDNNDVGSSNSFFGYAAGSRNSSGTDNTFLGTLSGERNTVGSQNTFIGKEAGNYNTTGGLNTFIGNRAGNQNTVGLLNTFVGSSSGNNNLNGNENAFFGFSSGLANSTGSANTFIGNTAGNQNTIGSHNTFLGNSAGFFNSVGFNNTHIGFNAGRKNISGFQNVTIGHSAASVTNSFTNSVFIGFQSNPINANTFSTNGVAIGSQAKLTANHMVRIGNTAITSIGGYQPWTDLSDQRMKENISAEVPGIEFIKRLEPVSYTMNYQKLSTHLNEKFDNDKEVKKSIALKSKKRQSGFLAQEVAALVVDMDLDFDGVEIPENEDGLYGIRYSRFVVPLIKAVQEQQAMIENLQNEIKKLREQ